MLNGVHWFKRFQKFLFVKLIGKKLKLNGLLYGILIEL